MHHPSSDKALKSKDDICDLIGAFGKWQKIIFAIFFFVNFPATWNNLVVVFYAPGIDHWCAPPPEYDNFSAHAWRNISIPRETNENGIEVLSQCRMYDHEGSDHKTIVNCNHWEFDTSFWKSTIESKWNLVCSRSWLTSFSQFAYMGGTFTGLLLFGQLADRFGRRPILLFNALMLFAAPLAIAFNPILTIFIILRFFTGVASAGIFGTNFVVLMEIVGPQYRNILGIAIEFGWATAYVALPGMAWLLRDFFYLQLAISLPSLFLVVYYWKVPESPRWLIANGKLEEAEAILEKAMSVNGCHTSDLGAQIKQIARKIESENEEAQKHKASVFDLFKTPSLRRNTCNLYFNWFVNSFVYYGLSLNTSNLGGDPFLNFFLAGAVEFPAYLVSAFVTKKIGLRLPLMATMVGGGIACIFTIPIPDDLLWLRITLAMLGKFFITASFGIVYVISSDVFPTVVRNAGLGSSSTCARIGSMTAPYIKEIGIAAGNELPPALFGGLSVLSGLMALFLPETHNQPIPDTLQEAEDLGKKKAGSKHTSSVPEKYKEVGNGTHI